MKGLITTTIKRCLEKGKKAKVAQRFLSLKHNIKIGNKALLKRVKWIKNKTN